VFGVTQDERPPTNVGIPGLDIDPALLDLDPDEFRRLGYWVVDRTIEHLDTLTDRPAITTSSYDALLAELGGPIPMSGTSLVDGLRLLADVALENQQHGDHPRYFARVPGPSSQVAILGDWLASGMQAVASSWGGGAGTAMVEVVALNWLRDVLGLNPAAEGVLVSGGSLASTTALITARAQRGPGVLYLSDQTHSSIKRGALGVGWNPDEIRVLPTDEDFRFDPRTAREAIRADLAAGLRPAILVGTAGTTNTGAIDDVPALAHLCGEFGMWLHIDGAYGGPAALAPDRNGIHGLELADSFVLDPHKWLFQPYDAACVWVAHPQALERTFAMYPEYLADTQGGAVDLHNRSLELTRRARGVKLWLTLRTYGFDVVVDAVNRGIALAEYAQQVVESDPRLTIVTPAQLGVVTFASTSADAAKHVSAVAEVTADGFAAATSTVLHGKTVIRLCTINPHTTTEDISRTISLLAEALEG
jgi:glutamate/tyrosine decarboxylase-like PLP-dependent enzyme